MSTTTRKNTHASSLLWATVINLMLVCTSANATILNAPTNGTFTMNLDRNALAPYAGGYYLSSFWDNAASDHTTLTNSGDHFIGQLSTTEISAVNRVFNLTAIGTDPTNQANQRFVKATSANFSIDSDTFSGVAGAKIGMTGLQGFYAPNWPPSGAGLVNGDFSVQFDIARQDQGRTGWYLANNIYFTMAVYDFSNLSIAFTDANNWRLSGDLLMSPENGGMLQGASLNNVGGFCLGAGSYAGCGHVSTVPIPAAAWLFISGLIGFAGIASRKR
ncbi:MAG: VPLPA-CTERM sorting domain-containing protein [Methylococcaceae bacterium]|nr:VPLPA-CTERM sorting domain-containing protein [Methylococcaceae bacterium]MDP3902694.1 VPLPA-CTERM sorting domain-containing protein [Methylococcaceae bacterium]